MFPTPLNSFWFRSALLMGVLRARNRVTKRSISESRGALGFHSHYRQPSKSSRIDEAQLATRSQLQNSVSMPGHLNFGRRDHEAPGHTEVYDPLPSCY